MRERIGRVLCRLSFHKIRARTVIRMPWITDINECVRPGCDKQWSYTSVIPSDVRRAMAQRN